MVFYHAANLGRLFGHEVTVLVEKDGDSAWIGDRARHLRIRNIDDVAEEKFDIAIATFWTTLFILPRIRSDAYVWFCQSLEDRFYPSGDPNIEIATKAIQLPIPVITEATWIRDLLKLVSPERQVELVLNGIDKSIFNCGVAPDSVSEPLHVLIEGDLGSHTKGIPFAVEGALGMNEPVEIRHLTRDARLLPTDERYEPKIGEFSFLEMADHYRWSDVIVKTSRVEGMFGPPLEAFHCGATAIVTPVTGHEEYILNGKNSIVVAWDDVDRLSSELDILASNRGLLRDLKDGALETAKSWIDWDESSVKFNEALNRIPKTRGMSISLRGKISALIDSRPTIVDGMIIKEGDKLLPGIALVLRLLNADHDFWLKQLRLRPFYTFKRAIKLFVIYLKRNRV